MSSTKRRVSDDSDALRIGGCPPRERASHVLRPSDVRPPLSASHTTSTSDFATARRFQLVRHPAGLSVACSPVYPLGHLTPSAGTASAPPCQHHPPPHRERTCIVSRLSTPVNRLMRLRSDPRPLRSPRPHRRLRRPDLPRRPPPPTHPCPSTPLPPPCRIAVDIEPDPMRHRSLAARACRALDLRPPPRHRRSGGFRPSPTIRRPA